MLAIMDLNNFGFATWKLPTELYVQRNSQWEEVQELHTLHSGTFKQVWNRNFWGANGLPHPHWRYALNYGFEKTDDTLSFSAFFSTNNAGSYTYPQTNRLQLNIGARDGNGFGNCYLDTATALRVSPGQTYTHSVEIVSATANTLFSLRAYSNVNKVDAFKGGAGRAVFETALQQVAPGTTINQNITIPANHNWIKLYLYIESTQALPRNYVFTQWRFTRNT